MHLRSSAPEAPSSATRKRQKLLVKLSARSRAADSDPGLTQSLADTSSPARPKRGGGLVVKLGSLGGRRSAAEAQPADEGGADVSAGREGLKRLQKRIPQTDGADDDSDGASLQDLNDEQPAPLPDLQRPKATAGGLDGSFYDSAPPVQVQAVAFVPAHVPLLQ